MTGARPFVVERKWATAPDITALRLVPVDGAPLAPIEPGSHVDVFVDRPGQPPLVRQYSLCNGPSDAGGYLIAVKREAASRGGSQGVHALSVGQTVHLGAVRNLFPLATGASKHLLVGAGIGITPLLSMAHALQGAGSCYDLHCFARGEAHVALRDQLQAIDAAGRLHLHLGLTGDAVEERLSRLLEAPGEAHLYHCGPGAFMDAVERIAGAHWPAERVHSERFQAPVAATPPDPATFVVRLHRSGVSCAVPPDKSIAQALSHAGHEIELSCEQGVCGTCLTTVLEGEPDHRDAYLSKAERSGGKLILPCVSRSCSPELVLDR